MPVNALRCHRSPIPSYGTCHLVGFNSGLPGLRRDGALSLTGVATHFARAGESREFTALSNVMKVKHDSAKAAINNIH